MFTLTWIHFNTVVYLLWGVNQRRSSKRGRKILGGTLYKDRAGHKQVVSWQLILFCSIRTLPWPAMLVRNQVLYQHLPSQQPLLHQARPQCSAPLHITGVMEEQVRIKKPLLHFCLLTVWSLSSLWSTSLLSLDGWIHRSLLLESETRRKKRTLAA